MTITTLHNRLKAQGVPGATAALQQCYSSATAAHWKLYLVLFDPLPKPLTAIATLLLALSLKLHIEPHVWNQSPFYMSSPLSYHANLHGLLRHVLRLALPLAGLLTVYLYLYPFFLACGFPLPTTPTPPPHGRLAAWLETVKLHLPGTDHDRPTPARRVAPFRLLALGDPQIEGDTSIPNAYKPSSFPHLHAFVERLVSRSAAYPTFRTSTRQALHDLVDFAFDDIPDTLESVRKRVDLLGNDFYLAHMYRTLRWWAVPTHVTVLGDLVGSQWISDAEFARRGRRFWRRAFRGAARVPDDAAAAAAAPAQALHDPAWRRRIMAVAGNHDVGYAGDLTPERLARFERVYGPASYALRFALPAAGGAAAAPAAGRRAPELRIVVLNSMNLDTPAADAGLQDQTYRFVNAVIGAGPAVEDKGHFTVVLTHVPLHKAAGVCVDAPFFSFHEDGTLREQNQLSADASRGFLEGIFGLSGDAGTAGRGQGRRGVILNGHDHEGCDTYHYINQSAPLAEPEREDVLGSAEPRDEDALGLDKCMVDGVLGLDKPGMDGLLAWDDPQQEPVCGVPEPKREWLAKRWHHAQQEGLVGVPSLPGLREITVRSMMGGYGGNAGLLSAWFDEEAWEWRFEYDTCALGAQHLWWAVHITDLVLVVLLVVYGVSSAVLTAGTATVQEPRSVPPSGTAAVKKAESLEWDRKSAVDGVEGLDSNGKANGRANGKPAQDS